MCIIYTYLHLQALRRPCQGASISILWPFFSMASAAWDHLRDGHGKHQRPCFSHGVS